MLQQGEVHLVDHGKLHDLVMRFQGVLVIAFGSVTIAVIMRPKGAAILIWVSYRLRRYATRFFEGRIGKRH